MLILLLLLKFWYFIMMYSQCFLQLASTKARDNKTNLMHFLAQVVEDRFPELLNFIEELLHVERAARG